MNDELFLKKILADLQPPLLPFTRAEAERLYLLAKVGASMKWIPVKEKMPEPGPLVLGGWDGGPDTNPAQGVESVIWTGKCWIEPRRGSEVVPPSHWMPLPEVPAKSRFEIEEVKP